MPTFFKSDLETRKQRKTREDRAFTKARKAVVALVLARDHHRCRCCGKLPDAWMGLDVHEEPPRSLGGDPLNPDQCVTLCRVCHDKVTAHLITLTVDARGTARLIFFAADGAVWSG